jgi:NAD(P)-dependent dehydrogenase (short-subunit alcohol dehydrogenase family)
VVRRFGREGFRSTLISRSASLDKLAPELRSGGLEIEAIGADIEDLDSYRETLERIFSVPGAPGVVVYNAALPDPIVRFSGSVQTFCKSRSGPSRALRLPRPSVCHV